MIWQFFDALETNNHNLISELIRTGLDTAVHRRLLDAAVACNSLHSVRALLVAGACVGTMFSYRRDIRGVFTESHVSCAARKSDAMLQTLLDSGVCVDEATNGVTALMTATKNGYLEAIQRLLRAGADVNALTANHKTALSLAVVVDRIDCVRLLLSAGALPWRYIVCVCRQWSAWVLAFAARRR